MNIHIEILMFEPETEKTCAHQLYMSGTIKCGSVPKFGCSFDDLSHLGRNWSGSGRASMPNKLAMHK